MHTATALSHPNIAFIKYWGNRNHVLRIPANGSISMNLGGLETRTQVTFNANLPADQLTLNGQPAKPQALARARVVLDRVRELSGIQAPASVTSEKPAWSTNTIRHPSHSTSGPPAINPSAGAPAAVIAHHPMARTRRSRA